MNRSNIIKLVLAVFLIGAVVVATFVYGNSQRKKQVESSPKNNLPTIESQSTGSTTNDPNVSVPQPSSGSQSQQSVSPQIPTAKTPTTGPADTLLASVVLGLLAGLYIISRRLYKS